MATTKTEEVKFKKGDKVRYKDGVTLFADKFKVATVDCIRWGNAVFIQETGLWSDRNTIELVDAPSAPAPAAEGFWYLATPYSKFPAGLEAAHKAACEYAATLIKSGVRIYCPIAHTHPIAVFGNIDPYSHAIWLPADRPFMDNAVGLIVVKMTGWEKSIGITEEIKTFKKAGKPILFMEA